MHTRIGVHDNKTLSLPSLEGQTRANKHVLAQRRFQAKELKPPQLLVPCELLVPCGRLVASVPTSSGAAPRVRVPRELGTRDTSACTLPCEDVTGGVTDRVTGVLRASSPRADAQERTIRASRDSLLSRRDRAANSRTWPLATSLFTAHVCARQNPKACRPPPLSLSLLSTLYLVYTL